MFERALAVNPGIRRWQTLYDHARANAISEIETPIPEVRYFRPEGLLAAPPAGTETLPPPLTPPRHGLFHQTLDLIGDGAGRALGLLSHLLVQAQGVLTGYREGVWTDWYRRSRFRALLTLTYMRDLLNKRNLVTSYPRGELVGFQPPGQRPPAGACCFRTADGSWNNLSDPMEGAAGTRFLRNVACECIRPESGGRLLTPNPRGVSLALLTRRGAMQEVPFLNLLAASWSQFQVHDWPILPPHFRPFSAASPHRCWLSGDFDFSRCSHAYEITVIALSR
jgi:hypothetical protein